MKDDDIRELLHGAVEDVRPRRDRADVLARLAADDGAGAGGHRLVPALAVAAAVVVVLGGLTWLQHNTPAPHPAAPSLGRDLSVAVYYVGDTGVGPRLFSERHVLHHVTASNAQAAVDAALGRADDPDYRSGFPIGSQARVRDRGDVVTVDFTRDVSPAPPGTAPGAGAVAAQALVWTLDAILERPVPVSIRVHGRPIATLLGTHLSQPITQASPDQALSPVSVQLAENARIASGTTVNGEAAAFGADVVWELRKGDATVAHGSTTAGQCCTLSPYAFTLNAPPGRYILRVSDTDPSGGTGNRVTTDTKDIEIR